LHHSGFLRFFKPLHHFLQILADFNRRQQHFVKFCQI
jgi:hypothetical protein